MDLRRIKKTKRRNTRKIKGVHIADLGHDLTIDITEIVDQGLKIEGEGDLLIQKNVIIVMIKEDGLLGRKAAKENPKLNSKSNLRRRKETLGQILPCTGRGSSCSNKAKVLEKTTKTGLARYHKLRKKRERFKCSKQLSNSTSNEEIKLNIEKPLLKTRAVVTCGV